MEASDNVTSTSEHGAALPLEKDQPSEEPSLSNPKLRKRTKTGCLTCRKRRIKCGEQRPSCSNCIKSKRICEGYNQRVIFKPPIGDFPNVHGGSTQTLQYHSGGLPKARSSISDQSTSGVKPAEVAPEFQNWQGPAQHDAYQSSSGSTGVKPDAPISSQSTTFGSLPFSGVLPGVNSQNPPVSTASSLEPKSEGIAIVQGHSSTYQSAVGPGGYWSMIHSANTTVSISTNPQDQPVITKETANPLPTYTESFQQSNQTYSTTFPVSGSSFGVPDQARQSIQSEDVNLMPYYPTYMLDPATLLDEAAVEVEDDDYYDVKSEDEMDIVPQASLDSADREQKDFSLIRNLYREHANDLNARRYDTFIYAGILDHYRAQRVANPLKNPKTARVFAHFIHATGLNLSTFERNPRNASALFTDSPAPPSQRSLWTYTLPMMALNNQGLLHAMLALASLHIAKLQGISSTPSFKHYAYSLKRIRKYLGSSRKKPAVTTLAATLLLAFYEVATADHIKWSHHLSGAKLLVAEIDYVGMTLEINRRRSEDMAFEQSLTSPSPKTWTTGNLASPTLQHTTGVDEDLVSKFVGRKVTYSYADPSYPSRMAQTNASVDIATYEVYQDLFWWYCSQDAYQSIVSGNKLFLDYSRWSDCPPRAALGRGDAIYASHDHLLLLLGRVADFASRDRQRKIKVMDSNGGSWRPGPDFPGGHPPGPPPGRPPISPKQGEAPQATTQPSTDAQGPNTSFQSSSSVPSAETENAEDHKTKVLSANNDDPGTSGSSGAQPQRSPGKPQTPDFFGMIPGVSITPRGGPESDPSLGPESSSELHDATAAALKEWQEIRSALFIFASHLGPAFQPLSAEYHQSVHTPFGEAKHYRSYDIGMIWATYHMCHIILWRSHPSMPPAAMMAVGVAAQLTGEAANEIGQICAGIVPLSANTSLTTPLGAAFTQCILPLFFSGVQYRDPEQRSWLIARLKDVEVRAGFSTATMIAKGCETAWEAAFKAGRGPPHRAGQDVISPDERLTRRLNPMSPSEPPEQSDRRFIHVNPGTRVFWALGLLSLDEDLKMRES